MIYNYIQGFRLINAIVRSLPAANIDTLLTDEVRASAFTKACGFYSQQSRFLETPSALQNLALSAKAYALLPEGVRLGILNDQTAIQNLTATILGEDPATFTFDDISQFVGDQAVMSVVFSSEPASQVIAASATAMNAIVNSGAALSVLWGKAPACTVMSASDVAKKLFVDAPDYLNIFKPAVLAGIVPDGMIFTAPGTFTVPAYVTNVHVVCIGAGGTGGTGGAYTGSYGGYGGGGGGALRWGNSIAVTPNQQIAVSVGAPSSFGTVVAGAGGAGGAPGDLSGNYVGGKAGSAGTGSGGNGGYNGGIGGSGGIGSNGTYGGGGGGGNGSAGSYSANGLAGGLGGPCNGSGSPGASGSYGSGGTATNGYGAPGSGGISTSPSGQPGSGICGGGGGYGGTGGTGGNGGPGVGSSPYGPSVVGDYGTRGKGVVRIIWGASRAFPSTNVEKIV